jgi:hypothetical protein
LPVEPELQIGVNRFVEAVKVPARLLALHPRKQGSPGKHAVISPAVVLTVTAAFEGFAEDLVAIAMHKQGSSFGQIARKIGNWNNPTLKQLKDSIRDLGISVPDRMFPVWRVPALGKTGIYRDDKILNLDECLDAADGWMQVRHCLSHGLATGLSSEYWPGPLKGGIAAQEVLRPMRDRKFSLTLHCAINCMRLYVWGAMHIADQVAKAHAQSLGWSGIPDLRV